MSIQVLVPGTPGAVSIERAVFTGLFDASVVNGYADYVQALKSGMIRHVDLVDLARKAQIPWPLFFAPKEMVQAQLKRKTDQLLAGVTKDAFSVNSRHRVQLADVELIVKDILRKQQLLKKHDKTLVKNPVVGRLKKSTKSIPEQADDLRGLLAFTTDDLKSASTKEKALDLLIGRFEGQQLLVAQSQQTVMPQWIPNRLKFSGICIKDAKIPYIFITSGEGPNPEPVGRRIFSLVLMAVLTARGRFSPVTYNDQTEEPTRNFEYELTEEILMPAQDVAAIMDSTDLESITAAADLYKVTPSAMVMRCRRLAMLSRDETEEHLGALQVAFAGATRSGGRSPHVMTALRKYNGTEYSQRMLRQLDSGAFPAKEFCRVVALNKFGPAEIDQFRSRL